MIRLNDPSTVGQTLRALREHGGYTPADVASIVIVPARRIELAEAGYLPTLADLVLTAMVYGYDVALTPAEDRPACECAALPLTPHVRAYGCEVATDRERKAGQA